MIPQFDRSGTRRSLLVGTSWLSAQIQAATGLFDLRAQRTDPDLAAHVMTTLKRGVVLTGAAIEDVFSDVPRENFLASVALDARESAANIGAGPGRGLCAVPNYAVLNFCRVLAYMTDDVVRSKIEGGEWALVHRPPQYRGLVRAALGEYRHTGSSSPVDAALLKRFARYADSLIRTATGSAEAPPP